MKVALPIWNNRISPLFDTACRVVIWSDGEGRGEPEEYDLRDLVPPMKVRRIQELGVEVLICGAVSNTVAYLVESAGIKLVPWISGPVRDVIEAFERGQLDESRYFMPGCGRMKRKRAGGGRGRAGTGGGRGKGRRGQIEGGGGQDRGFSPAGGGGPEREER